MATYNFAKFHETYGDNPLAKSQAIDHLRQNDTNIGWSEFEQQGLDNVAIFDTLAERDKAGQPVIAQANNPAKPIDIKPTEQIYSELRALDSELESQSAGELLLDKGKQFLNKTIFNPESIEKRIEKGRELINYLKKNGVTAEQFQKEYGESKFLTEFFFDKQDVFAAAIDMTKDVKNAITGQSSQNAQNYNKELEAYKLYQELGQKRFKNDQTYHKLNAKQREIIEQSVGAVSAWWRNNSDVELVDYFLDLENAKESMKRFMPAYTRLQNVNIHEQFFGLTGKEKDLDKRQKQVVEDYGIIAETLGFDGIAYNKTGMYFIKDEKAYKVEQHFWDELREITKANAGAIIGGITGAGAGVVKGGFLGMVKYGAAGAAAGGAFDSVLTDILASKNIDIPQALLHASQEGVFNIIADGVFKIVGTGFKYFNPSKLKDIAGKVSDYTPVVGMLKRAHDGNKNSAEHIIANAVDKDTQAMLKEVENFLGAEINIGELKNTAAKATLEKIEAKHGSESFITKGAKKVYEIFALQDQKSAQKNFIRAIRADESGNLTAFLAEAANSSPKMQKTLQEILSTTSTRLKDQLQGVGLKPNTIKQVFDDLERGTKQSYNDAIENVLGSVYDDSYRVILRRDSANVPEHLELGESAKFNTQSYDSFRKELENSGVLPEDSMKFLSFVENTIYNPKGVSFNQLNNALKTINSYYKQATDPNFKHFVKNAVEGFIKRDIKSGIEQIFKQNSALYDDARELFETALSDYARMKDTLKMVDKLRLRDKASSYQQVTQRLSKFFLAQGDEIPNFQALLAPLQKEAREEFELKLLQDMLELSMVRLSDDIAVADTTEFFKRLEPLKSQFASKSAHDFIEIAQNFHTLFKNDATLARMLKPTTTDTIGSSIATSVEGAVKFQAVKMLFANIVRLLPHIPFAKRLNESVQGSALRFHLKKALDSSLSVGEFKLTLKARASKANFTNATREKINQILAQTNAEQLAAKELEAGTDIKAMRAESLEGLQALRGAQAQNLSDGRVAVVAKDSLEKMLSGKAIGKSIDNGFSVQEHIKAVGEVLQLFQNAALKESQPPKNASTDIVAFHKYLAPFENAQAKITIKELTQGGDKVYSLELLELAPRPKHDLPSENSTKALDTSYTGGDRSSNATPPDDVHGLDSSAQKQTSIFELAQAEKQAKEAAELEKERANAQALAEAAQAIKQRDEALQATKDANAGKSEAQRTLHHGEPIAMRETDLPHTSISVSDEQIVPLKFVVVKARDVQPNFSASELQPRAAKDERVIEQIASNFSPALIFGRGGYKDLPIIKADGQVVLGNHRVQGFKDFSKDFNTPARTLTKEQAKDTLEHITPEKLPDKLEPQEFLDGFSHIINKENFLTHLHKTPDAKERLGVLSLVQPTHERPDLELITTNAKGEPTREYVKAFENNDKQIFYVLITPQDNDKILLTGFPTSKKREIVRRINNAEAIKARDSGEISSAQSYNKSPTPSEHSTTQKLQNSRAAYEKAVKDHYGVDLAPDELLLRTPAEPLSDEQLIQIAFHSNKDDVKTLSDKTLAALGRYAPKMKDLPIIITSESLQELKAKVARTLAPEQALPDEREAGLALLAHLSKSTRQSNIAEVLNSLHHLEPQTRERVLGMFIDNAGSFYNLSHRTASLGMQNLDLRPYLLETMAATAEATFKERWENFARLNENLRHIIDTTDAQGRNAMIDIMPRVYENTMSEILGAALARFTRLENPSENLYHTLKAAPKELEELHAPAFDFESGGVTAGKSLQDMDIIDLADYLIRTGESSKEVRESLELLPKFREKWEAYKNASKESAAKDGSEAGESSELKTLRDNLQEILTPILHKDIENLNTGITAQVSKTSIKKMGSDKAVQKSIENGFTKEQHFHASADIENLYKNAAHKTTRADEKNGDIAIKIHEFSALVDEKTQAKILVKESIDKDARKIYTIELEELTPATPMNPRTDGDIASQAPKSKLESGAPLTPLDDVGGNSSAKVFNMQDTTLDTLENFSKFSSLAGVPLEDMPLSKIKSLHGKILERIKDLEC